MRIRKTVPVPVFLAVFILLANPIAAESIEEELMDLTKKLLTGIYVDPSSEFYSAHVAEDVTCYEGLPTRLDGIEYHLKALDSLASTEQEKSKRHIELLNPKVQLYGDVGIFTATVQFTTFGEDSIESNLLNETRVWAKIDGNWKLVHFHKSPVKWPYEE